MGPACPGIPLPSCRHLWRFCTLGFLSLKCSKEIPTVPFPSPFCTPLPKAFAAHPRCFGQRWWRLACPHPATAFSLLRPTSFLAKCLLSIIKNKHVSQACPLGPFIFPLFFFHRMSTEHSLPLWILGEKEGCFSFMPWPKSLMLCWLQHIQRTEASCMQISSLIFLLPSLLLSHPSKLCFLVPTRGSLLLLKGAGVRVSYYLKKQKKNSCF